MQQGDQTVLSLRPGGGRGSRLFNPRLESSSSSALSSSSIAFGDLPLLRPHGGAPLKTGDSRFETHDLVRYTRDQLVQLREAVVISDEILKIKREIEGELFGEDQSWGRGEINTPNQSQSRYSEPDNRDWRGRTAQFSSSGEERSWDSLRENRDLGGRYDSRQPDTSQFNRQDQLNSQFARAQISSNQSGGPAPALVKAEVPEGLLISAKQLPYKSIEFLENRGFLIGITNENDIEVWNLESRCLACCLRWDSNITAFSVINGSYLMLIGDEYGLMSVVKYVVEDSKLLRLPYHIVSDHLKEAAGFPSVDHQPIVGVLPQPCSSGKRVLIAYVNGLIILWDFYEARILFVGGGKDLQLKDGSVDSQRGADTNLQENASYNHLQGKEISALCWASSNGSILAVGYVDGDILFWKTSTGSSVGGQQNEPSGCSVVKLQLSSSERRLPVIVLHWSASNRSSNDCDGQLFIYGGDEIGSEEVLTVLNLEWSSGMGTVKCKGRIDLTLAGSFADMILLPSAGSTRGNHKAAVFVLTNPGQLYLYDDASLSVLLSQQEKEKSACALEFPAVVPMVDPPMTMAKLTALPIGGNSSKVLSEMASVKTRGTTPAQASDTKWPLTGGVPVHLSSTEQRGVERVYIAGYQDGSVRIWNASYPFLSLICILEGKVDGLQVASFNAPISNVDFCSLTSNLAVGNEHGLVQIYNLNGSSNERGFHLVTEAKHEVLDLPHKEGPHCKAVFSLLNSPICALQYANSGAKLAVGFERGKVAVLDMSSLSVLFFTDCVSSSSSPVISVTWKNCGSIESLVKSPKETNIVANHAEEVMFVLTKDALLNIIDGGSGSMMNSHPWRPKKRSIAISMYVIEENNTSVSTSTNGKYLEEANQDVAINKDQPVDETAPLGANLHCSKRDSLSGIAVSGERLMDSHILVCYEDSMRLYNTKSVIQGSNKSIFKVKHSKPCCWTSTLRKDEKVCGLILLFQTGAIEIRSFPDLELVKESSLMSILRWNYKASMEKKMGSDNGQITLANGCELAFVSLLSGENGFRIPDSLPCLHDKVLAAAADAAISFSSNQKKKQGIKPGILAGIVKGFKSGKAEQTTDATPTPQSNFSHLENIFSKPPFSDSSPAVTDSQEAVELNIDDIEIDESPLPIGTSSQDVKNIKKEKGTEREQLLGKADDIKPRLRTPEEIMAQYRKAGDASSVAAHARNKLVERQEKLERISRRTAELQNGAEDFASLANELVKAMENRKWWQV